MNNESICCHCEKSEKCKMFRDDPHAVVRECGRYKETELHKQLRMYFKERGIGNDSKRTN